MPPSARSAQLKEKMNPSLIKQFWVPYLVFGNCILYVGAIRDFNSSTPDCQGQNGNKLFALSAFLPRNLPPKNRILRQFLTPKRKSNPEGFSKMADRDVTRHDPSLYTPTNQWLNILPQKMKPCRRAANTKSTGISWAGLAANLAVLVLENSRIFPDSRGT